MCINVWTHRLLSIKIDTKSKTGVHVPRVKEQSSVNVIFLRLHVLCTTNKFLTLFFKHCFSEVLHVFLHCDFHGPIQRLIVSLLLSLSTSSCAKFHVLWRNCVHLIVTFPFERIIFTFLHLLRGSNTVRWLHDRNGLRQWAYRYD